MIKVPPLPGHVTSPVKISLSLKDTEVSCRMLELSEPNLAVRNGLNIIPTNQK